jgi:molybdopterin/thiamine biosynthesis adenylyltransferase
MTARLGGLLHRAVAAIRRTSTRPSPPRAPIARSIDVRITADMFEQVRTHVETFDRGEESGFLICSLSRLADRDVLLAREWHPIPDSAIERNAHGSVLSSSAQFNSDILKRAVDLDATAVLVHSHGTARPRFSADDRTKERALFAAFSRILDPLPTGTLLLGKGDAVGSFWTAGNNHDTTFRRLTMIGDTIDHWYAVDTPRSDGSRQRLDRQTVAIGPLSDAKLKNAVVAIIGVSGGGSHVFQQLAHQGVGTLIPVDDQILDETNLGRHVGATASDIDRTLKTAIAKRLAAGVDPDTVVREVNERFPSTATIEAMKDADVVVACLDRFDAREAVNAFCRRYLIPLVDVGMSITSAGERLADATGQVIASLPGEPCLRCFFLTDSVLAWEREHRPPGYDQNPDAPGDPQVVSMNGVLASEACNTVLDLITGYSGGRRGARQWQYDGRTGALEPTDLPSRRPGCPGCAEQGLGDPQT